MPIYPTRPGEHRDPVGPGAPARNATTVRRRAERDAALAGTGGVPRQFVAMEQLLASLQKWFDPHMLGELLLNWTGKVLAALAIFVIGRLVAGWASRSLVAAMQRVGLDRTLAHFFGNLAYIALVAMVVLTAVNTLDVLRAEKRVLAKPASEIVVNELGANGVSIVVRAWVATADQAGARSDLLERIQATFAERGLSIPYPRMRLEQRPQGAE